MYHWFVNDERTKGTHSSSLQSGLTHVKEDLFGFRDLCFKFRQLLSRLLVVINSILPLVCQWWRKEPGTHSSLQSGLTHEARPVLIFPSFWVRQSPRVGQGRVGAFSNNWARQGNSWLQPHVLGMSLSSELYPSTHMRWTLL
jgi:hypothetical protein